MKATTTSGEFLQWIEWLNEQEVAPPTRLEQYLAQVAAEVRLLRLSNSKKKVRVKLSDLFLIFRFKTSTDTSTTPMTEEEIVAKKKAVSERSKARWLAWAGVKDVDGNS